MSASIGNLEDAWRYNLDTYATRVSEGRWQRYGWAVYLARVLTDLVLSGDGGRLIVMAPPRHGKSETTSRWLPTWYLDLFPENRVILTSYAEHLAADWSEKVKQTFESPNPDVWAKTHKKRSARGDWRTTEGGGMRAAGVGSGITGFGGDLILIDDPHKDWAEVQSPGNRLKVVDWFNGTLYHRAEPGATIVLIQTRWHENDLAGYLMSEHHERWDVVRLPAVSEGGDDELGRKEGQPLCPERYDIQQLKKIENAVGPAVWAGLFQQRPAPLEGGLIKRVGLRFYKALPRLEEFQIHFDLTFSASGKSFYVGSVWARDADERSHKYLVDLVRAKGDFVDQIASIKSLAAKHPQATGVFIEEAANGAAAIATLRRELAQPPIVSVKVVGSKEARVQSVLPEFDAGNVWVPHQSVAPWSDEYVHELITFPNGANDDQVDVTTQALSQFRKYESEPIELNLGVGIRPKQINPTVDSTKL